MFKKFESISISLIISIFLVACGDKEAPAKQSSISETSKPAEASKPPEVKVEFALNCVGEKSSRTPASFVSLGDKALLTIFSYKYRYTAVLSSATPEKYSYTITGKEESGNYVSESGKTIELQRDSLRLVYFYGGPQYGGQGADGFTCVTLDDPAKALETSNQLVANEAKKAADDAERARIQEENAKQEQLKRNKI